MSNIHGRIYAHGVSCEHCQRPAVVFFRSLRGLVAVHRNADQSVTWCRPPR